MQKQADSVIKTLLKCTRNKDNSFHIENLHLSFFKKMFWNPVMNLVLLMIQQ